MKTIIRNHFKETKIVIHKYKWNIYKIIPLLFSFKFYHDYKNYYLLLINIIYYLLLNILIFHFTFKHKINN